MIALLAPLLLKIGIPARFHKAVLLGAAVVMLLAGFGLWLHFHDNAVRKADRNAANAEAVSEAREADERAEKASTGKKNDVEKGNRDAEDAARNSDDPLANGLRCLRDHTAC